MEPFNSFVLFSGDVSVHENNLFSPANVAIGGWEASASELIVKDAGLSADYHIANASSPALDAGISAVYSEDRDGDPVPCGAAPDIDADEYCD